MVHKLPVFWRILAYIVLTLAAAFSLLPVLGMLRLALDASVQIAPTDFRLVPGEFTTAIMQKMWLRPAQSLSFLGLLKNSLFVSAGSALACVLLGSGVAYGFARYRFIGRTPGLFFILLGSLLPPVALMTPLYILLTALGLRTNLAGLIVVYTAFILPFSIWNMRAAFQSIPREVEEGAFLDGASPWVTFWRITLPLALPSIAVTALISFLAAYSEFAIGWLFVERSDTVTLAMALIGAFNSSAVSWGEMSALAVMMSLPVILVFILLQKQLIDQFLFDI